MYENLIRKIIEAYVAIGFRPQPGVWIDKRSKTCNPLVALAIHKEGHDKFMSMGGQFYSDFVLRKYLMDEYFKRNWQWVFGFNDAYNLQITRTWWKELDCYRFGYRAGREIRRKLKELYYKKDGPTNASKIETGYPSTSSGGVEETNQERNDIIPEVSLPLR